MGSTNNVTRRGFLKTAGVAAGAFGLAGTMASANGWLSPAKAIAQPEDTQHTPFTIATASATAI